MYKELSVITLQYLEEQTNITDFKYFTLICPPQEHLSI